MIIFIKKKRVKYSRPLYNFIKRQLIYTKPV